MDILSGLLVFILGTLCFLAAVFLALGQLIWGIIDVAVSPRHSGGTKASVILLTCLLLGPIMTFFYACFGTHTTALKRTTIGSFIVLVISGGGLAVLASVHNATHDRLTRLVDHRTGFLEGAKADTVYTKDLDLETFKAVHYVPLSPRKWSVSVSDFDTAGIVRDSGVAVSVPSIYPLNQIAVDPETGRTYGITTHKFGYIVPATGHFVEIEGDPSLPGLSWPSAIAFDETNRRVIVVGRGAAFSYDPKTGAWEEQPEFANLGLISLTYDASEGVFYGLVSDLGSKTVDSIVRLDSKGAALSVIRLADKLVADELPDGRVQLRKPGHFLIILVSSHFRENGREERLVEQRMYVVDPSSGQIALARS
jgi:hypothetical protein